MKYNLIEVCKELDIDYKAAQNSLKANGYNSRKRYSAKAWVAILSSVGYRLVLEKYADKVTKELAS